MIISHYKKFIMKKFILGAALAVAFTATSASAFTYTSGLIKVGSRGAQVSELQTCMNALGHSTGVVDGIFGTNTKAGVMSFQASKGVAADGVIGPVTGPLYTSACADTDSNSGSNNNNSGSFNTNGEEASPEDFKFSSEDDAEEGVEQHVATIEFDVEDGDLKIERADLTFVKATPLGTADTRPWDVFENVTLKVDGKEIASMDVDSKSDWREDTTPFQVRLSGMSYVVEAGDTAEIEVYLTAQDNIDDVANADWTIYVDNFGIRGTDTAGLTQEVGKTTDTVTFGIDSEGGDEDITIKASSKNPSATTLKVEDDQVSDEYEIFVFDLESDENDIDVDTINLTLTTVGASYTALIDEVWLEIDGETYDDVTETYGASIAGGNPAAGVTNLSFDIDSDLTIDADKKESVSLYVAFKKQDPLASGVTVKAATVMVEGEGVDDVSDIAVVNGNVHSLVETGFEISDVKFTLTEGGATAGIIDVDFKVTADDDDIVVLQSDVVTSETGTGTATKEANLIRVSGSTSSVVATGTGFTVLAGQTATLRLRFNVGAAAGETAQVRVESIKGQEVDMLSSTLILRD